jgi:hypothetical protein
MPNSFAGTAAQRRLSNVLCVLPRSDLSIPLLALALSKGSLLFIVIAELY